MDYNRINHTKFLIVYHIILVAKYRHPILNLFNIKDIFKTIEKESDFIILEMEVDINHIHLLIQSVPKYSISQVIRKLKQESTIISWMKHHEILHKYYWKRKVLWSKGYFVCTIGNASKDVIQKYIRNQG